MQQNNNHSKEIESCKLLTADVTLIVSVLAHKEIVNIMDRRLTLNMWVNYALVLIIN